MIDASVFKDLLTAGAPSVSLYLPTEESLHDPRAMQTQLRAMVARAERGLAETGVDAEQSGRLLGVLQDVADGIDVGFHRGLALAFFASATVSHIQTLPVAVSEALVVSDGFHVKPLLPLMARNRRFNVLALSAGDARLYSATPTEWDEVALDILPDAAEAELAELESAHAVPGRHGSTRTMAGSSEDLRHAVLIEDMGRVAHAVRHALATDEAPLLLVAEPQVVGHFRALAHLPQLLAEPLMLNPFAFAPRDLHARAIATIRPLLDDAAEAVLEQVRARLGSAQANVGVRLEEILAHAAEGRVDAVVVAEDEALWGHPPAGSADIHAHGHQVGCEPDLLNEAALRTLRHGGRAFALPRERLPRHAPAVATYRF